MNYIYISSVEHSGSTLLACILDSHPEVSSVGEFGIPFNPNLTCACGAITSECSYWVRWQEEVQRKGLPFNLGNFDINILSENDATFWNRLFYHQFSSPWLTSAKDLLYFGSGLKSTVKSKVKYSIELASILCKLDNTNTFVDSSKNGLQIRHLAKSKEIDFKTLGIVRDGRAVMKSLIKRENYSQSQAIDAWLYGNKHLTRAARHIAKNSSYILKLEELCNRPEEIKQELFTFLGIDANKELDYRSEKRHIIGNSMRSSFDGEIRAHDDSWRDYLSKSQLDEFERRAGWLNRELGYDRF